MHGLLELLPAFAKDGQYAQTRLGLVRYARFTLIVGQRLVKGQWRKQLKKPGKLGQNVGEVLIDRPRVVMNPLIIRTVASMKTAAAQLLLALGELQKRL